MFPRPPFVGRVERSRNTMMSPSCYIYIQLRITIKAKGLRFSWCRRFFDKNNSFIDHNIFVVFSFLVCRQFDLYFAGAYTIKLSALISQQTASKSGLGPDLGITMFPQQTPVLRRAWSNLPDVG